jgi:hypothetical protein
MKALVEWCFDFRLEPGGDAETVPRAVAETVLLDVAIPWAEAHGYGIGGGPGELGDGSWSIDFGLCATRKDQRIPEAEALELADVMTKFCESRGARLIGRVRDFAEVSAELDALWKDWQAWREEEEAARQRNRENPKFCRPPRQ